MDVWVEFGKPGGQQLGIQGRFQWLAGFQGQQHRTDDRAFPVQWEAPPDPSPQFARRHMSILVQAAQKALGRRLSVTHELHGMAPEQPGRTGARREPAAEQFLWIKLQTEHWCGP